MNELMNKYWNNNKWVVNTVKFWLWLAIVIVLWTNWVKAALNSVKCCLALHMFTNNSLNELTLNPSSLSERHENTWAKHVSQSTNDRSNSFSNNCNQFNAIDDIVAIFLITNYIQKL
jgi:hypothetical protein